MKWHFQRPKPSKQFESVHCVASQAEARKIVEAADCLAVVTRGVPRLLLMRCPCGCAELVTLNLDPRSGPSWKITQRKGRISLSPSVWRESACNAHYFLW